MLAEEATCVAAVLTDPAPMRTSPIISLSLPVILAMAPSKRPSSSPRSALMVLVRSPALMFSTTSSTSWIGLVMPREITSVTTMLTTIDTIEKTTSVVVVVFAISVTAGTSTSA